MKKIVVFLFLAAALLLSACGPAAAAVPEACKADLGCAKISKGQTIKIGYAGPMTGDYSQFGKDMSQAMKIAATDSVDFQGWKFELLAEDDQASAEGAAAVANKLITDTTYVAMAGHAFSGATSAAMPIYEKAGIPMLSPSATDPTLTTKGSKVFNRNAFTDADQAAGAANFLFTTLGKKKLALIHDGTDYGQGLAKGVESIFKTLGGEVVAFEAITPGEADYTAVLAAIASKGPDAIYFGGYVGEGAVLINELKASGLGGVVFFGGDGIYGNDLLVKTGANSEGVYSATLVPPASELINKFNAAYKTAYGVEAGVLSAYTWTSYDSFMALASVIRSVGIVDGETLYIPRGALVTAVRNIKDYAGLAGVITCRENGECNASGPVFYVAKGGKWEPAK